ncbi:MAG TPA: amidohydrolase family protein, partial [Terriglobales bacterium]|nr:amidohydrolase family protein [Terriglobales bacterium]
RVCVKIDSHQHFWHYEPARHNWITNEMAVLKRDYLPADLNRELRATGMDASIAVQADQSEGETLLLLDLAERYPTIAGVVGWVDLCADDLPERLQSFSHHDRLCGFRHVLQDEPDDRFMLRKSFVRGIAGLREFDFTYDILIYPRQLPAAIELVAKFPEQAFVIDHLAKPPIKTGETARWAGHIRKIATAPHVFCKLSGLITEAEWGHWREENFRPYLDIVFEAFGPDRLMFGSDWPVCLLAGAYGQVKQLVENYVQDLTNSEKDNIFGWNAARFYRLASPNGTRADK